jgi:hypothetical protein
MTALLAAGYQAQHLLEAIGVVAASTMTNNAGNVVLPPVEAALDASAATAGLAAWLPSSGGSG